jgi:aryl-alcohol dehydrogenase-like predicted oxidoreductase
MIERAAFGRTGHESTRVIFGAAALGRMRQERADEVMATLVEFGVNHLDVAASYGDAELRLAPWLAAHPDRFFLATKTGERTGDGARAELERSLERLGVDRVDLIQLHNLVEEDEWATAHGPGGAVEAMVRARDEGLVRFIGVTGHGLRIPRMHLRSLERFAFDSVLFPYNHSLLGVDAYRADVEELLAVCVEAQVATQTFSWYRPLDDGAAVARAARWVLAHPGLFLNTSSDARLLRSTLTAASTPGPVPTDADMVADADELGIEAIFDGGALERI